MNDWTKSKGWCGWIGWVLNYGSAEKLGVDEFCRDRYWSGGNMIIAVSRFIAVALFFASRLGT